jgi:plasmid stabilization system protein ParE
MKVVYAERARRDIADIYDSIARHNPAAAQRVEDAIRVTCEGLSDFPYASVATNEPNVRRVPWCAFPTQFSIGSTLRATLLRLAVSFTARA